MTTTLDRTRSRLGPAFAGVLAACLLAVAFAAAAPSAAAANGCGPADWRGRFVPSEPFGFNFRPACNRHDVCYATPWRRVAYSYAAAKRACDQRFYGDMSAYCYRSFIGTPNIYRWCQYTAYGYYTAVSRYGDSAYRNAQRG
jgi:hypothetical protein